MTGEAGPLTAAAGISVEKSRVGKLGLAINQGKSSSRVELVVALLAVSGVLRLEQAMFFFSISE